MINQENIKYCLQTNVNIQIFILKQIFIWSLTFKIKTCYTLQITTHYK